MNDLIPVLNVRSDGTSYQSLRPIATHVPKHTYRYNVRPQPKIAVLRSKVTNYLDHSAGQLLYRSLADDWSSGAGIKYLYCTCNYAARGVFELFRRKCQG